MSLNILYFCDKCKNRCYLYEEKNELLYICMKCSKKNQENCDSEDCLDENHYLLCEKCRVSYKYDNNRVYFKTYNRKKIDDYSQYQFDNRLQIVPDMACNHCKGEKVGMLKNIDMSYSFICQNETCGKIVSC